MVDRDTPADVLSAHADNLASRIDSGSAPEIYRNAVTLLAAHEERTRVQFVALPRDILDELAALHTDWEERDEANDLYHVDARDLADAVRRLLDATGTT